MVSIQKNSLNLQVVSLKHSAKMTEMELTDTINKTHAIEIPLKSLKSIANNSIVKLNKYDVKAAEKKSLDIEK